MNLFSPQSLIRRGVYLTLAIAASAEIACFCQDSTISFLVGVVLGSASQIVPLILDALNIG